MHHPATMRIGHRIRNIQHAVNQIGKRFHLRSSPICTRKVGMKPPNGLLQRPGSGTSNQSHHVPGQSALIHTPTINRYHSRMLQTSRQLCLLTKPTLHVRITRQILANLFYCNFATTLCIQCPVHLTHAATP